jgi:hypothetical protein
LDTNNLHFCRLYIDFAEKEGLAPFSTGDFSAAAAQLKARFLGRTLNSYTKGSKLVEYLRKRCAADSAQVEYCPVTGLEVICGLLRGKAILDAAQEGITHRMWGKIEEAEILDRLTPAIYNDVQQHVTDVEGQFQKAGIDLRETDPGRLRETWGLARALLGLIYLDVDDAIVYASALLAEADEFLTADSYLKTLANNIQNAGGLTEPDKTYFLTVQGAIANLLAKMIGVSVAEVTLPKAKGGF